MNYTLHLGNCLDTLRGMADNSVDSIVTDPPYGLTQNKKGGTGVASVNLENPYGRARIGTGNGAGGFMGMKWDSDVPSVEIWAECLRVLKPGGHLLAFAGTRTQHRMAVRIEDAGFEIRDMIAWVYGSGFPKSHNGEWGGTALKPALEPITVARKPLIGTVEANWREHGTGALNIDGCRVHSSDSEGYAYTVQRMMPGAGQHATGKTHQEGVEFQGHSKDGRWPANLIHDGSDEVLAAFPESTGSGPARTLNRSTGNRAKDWGMNANESDSASLRDAGTGSAARFFYCAKASRADRNDGLEDPGPQFTHGVTLRQVENMNAAGERKGNIHPTVKPTDLMRYLVRLVTPPGGVVLDPFMGSGSTGKAAMLEGFQFVGCELSPEYLEIARARIEAARTRADKTGSPKPVQKPKPRPVAQGQNDLFEAVA